MTSTIAAPITYTINCPICDASITGAPAKYIHRCDVRAKGKLISREFIGYFEGMPVCYKSDGRDAQRELDEYVFDLLSRTQAETADQEADAAQICPVCLGEGRVPNGSGCGELAGGWADVCECIEVTAPTLRTYWCFVESCSYEPRHMLGDKPLCCGHFCEAGQECKCFSDPPVDEPTPGGDPWPESVQAGIAAFNRLSETLHTPIVCDALLAEADAVLRAEGCAACGGRHEIQLCPSIWSLLRAPDAERLSLELVERMAEATL